MLLVGQSLTWHPGTADARLREAVRRREAATVLARARRQVEAGAHALDLNAGVEGSADDLAWVASTLRDAGITLPLWLDSTDLAALRTVLRSAAVPVVLNAVPVGLDASHEEARVLETATAAGAGVVISPRLAATDGVEVGPYVQASARAVDRARRAGVHECYVDALVYPASRPAATRASLRRIEGYRDALPGVPALAAVGNVSAGSRRGNALRAAFTALAVEAGAGAFILPVEQPGLVEVAGGGGPPADEAVRAARRLILEG